MNAIGKLGEIIIKYQEPIMTAVIVIAVAAVILIVVKAIRTAGRNKELLSQINDTVAEINTNVSNIREKDKEKDSVIYIDNRPSERVISSDEIKTGEVADKSQYVESAEPEGVAEPEESAEPVGAAEPEETAEPEEITEPEGTAETEEVPKDETENAEDTEDEQAPVHTRKYFSRDCAVDRHGRQYTVEELEKQIKE